MKLLGVSAMAMGIALLAAPSVSAQEGPGWSWLAKEMATDVGTCTAAKQAPKLSSRLGGLPFGKEAAQAGGAIVKGALGNSGLSPLCTVNTSAGLMLVTTSFLDDSTINTGIALDQAQKQLVPAGQQISLAIAQMLETRAGMTNPSAAMGKDRENTEAAYDDAAKQVVTALEEIERNGVELTPEISDALIEVSANLTKGKYYLIKSAVGLELTRQKVSDQGLQSLQPGLNENFISKAPDRFQSAARAIPNILAVERAIDSVSDRKLASKIKKARRKAEDEAEDEVKSSANRSDSAAQSVNWD